MRYKIYPLLKSLICHLGNFSTVLRGPLVKLSHIANEIRKMKREAQSHPLSSPASELSLTARTLLSALGFSTTAHDLEPVKEKEVKFYSILSSQGIDIDCFKK